MNSMNFKTIHPISLILILSGCENKADTKPVKQPLVRVQIESVPSNEVTQREFKVLEIIDGNTFKILYNNEKTSVRIANIDAPERDEPGYKESKKFLESLIKDKLVRLAFTEKKKRDRFGRLLAQVLIRECDDDSHKGSFEHVICGNVGWQMVKNNHAREWVSDKEWKKTNK